MSEVAGVTGAVVVVDVLRAFTTAAYAFAGGAEAIYLTADIGEALRFKQENPASLAMGEEDRLRPPGFDFSNSPAEIQKADLRGLTLIQRTSAGTRGVVAAAPTASRLWASSLVCASATAAAVTESRLGQPTYVITGCTSEDPDITGHDDRETASLIERARLEQPLEVASTVEALRKTWEVKKLLTLSKEHADPADIELAAEVDRFDFAMEVVEDERGLRLVTSRQLFE